MWGYVDVDVDVQIGLRSFDHDDLTFDCVFVGSFIIVNGIEL